MVKVSDDLSLPGNAYRIRIAGVIVGRGSRSGRTNCLRSIRVTASRASAGAAVKDPSFGLDALWIADTARADAIAAGYTVVDAPTVIATHLNQILPTTSAAELFGLDDAQALIDNLKESYPQLAHGLTPAPYSLAAITALVPRAAGRTCAVARFPPHCRGDGRSRAAQDSMPPNWSRRCGNGSAR